MRRLPSLIRSKSHCHTFHSVPPLINHLHSPARLVIPTKVFSNVFLRIRLDDARRLRTCWRWGLRCDAEAVTATHAVLSRLLLVACSCCFGRKRTRLLWLSVGFVSTTAGR